MALYRVKTSSWLLALVFAVPLGVLGLGLGLSTFWLSGDSLVVAIVVCVCALGTGALAVWMAVLGLRTRHCRALLTDAGIDVTTYVLDQGGATRRLASAQISWGDVQRLITESYDVVNAFGLRWPFRNLYLFSARGDFVFYGVAWKKWDALAAEIVERSGRQPDAAATERAADVDALSKQMRRTLRVMRVTSWISVALIVLMTLAALLATFD